MREKILDKKQNMFGRQGGPPILKKTNQSLVCMPLKHKIFHQTPPNPYTQRGPNKWGHIIVQNKSIRKHHKSEGPQHNNIYS